MCSDIRCSNLSPKIQRLLAAVESDDHLTPSRARHLLEASDITQADLAPWADFDHPPEDSYGRRLIYNGGFYELMAMSWVDGDMAAIHDHGYTQWGAVKLFGAAEHAIFRIDDGTLTTAERKVFEPGSVVGVGHDLIHQMGNVGHEPYMTLHLYGCYQRDSDITADARLYNLHAGEIEITSGGVFFDLPNNAINRREEAPNADFPTELRDKVELLRRCLRSNGTLEEGSWQCAQESQIAAELFAADTWRRAKEELQQKEAEASPHQLERYLDVFHQELGAAARLKHVLLKADLVENPPITTRDLDPVLEAEQSTIAGRRFLDLLSETFSLELETISV